MSIKFDECQITKIFTTSSLGVKASFDVINSTAVINDYHHYIHNHLVEEGDRLTRMVRVGPEMVPMGSQIVPVVPQMATLVLKRYQCVPKWSQKVTKWSQWVHKW